MNFKYVVIGLAVMIISTVLGVLEYRRFSQKIKSESLKSSKFLIILLNFIGGGGFGVGMIFFFIIGFLFFGSGLKWW